ncbi:MAG: hypothetical protein LBU47_05425 [Christensenellaceae bacterium]|jgi:hypothetical protein|nr:hypothetical protein [Christensenellaceae bacterium]
MALIRCLRCKTRFDGNFCPRCGLEAPHAASIRWPAFAICFSAAMLFCAGALLLVLFASRPGEAWGRPMPGIPELAKGWQDEESGWFQPGQYLVGQDIPQGEYYFLKQTSLTEDEYAWIEVHSSLIETDYLVDASFYVNYMVFLHTGQLLVVSDAMFIPSRDVPPHTDWNEGFLRVGVDIPAGEYTVRPKSSAWYGRLSLYHGTDFTRIENFLEDRMFNRPISVSLQDGDCAFIEDAELIRPELSPKLPI